MDEMRLTGELVGRAVDEFSFCVCVKLGVLC